jgi:hypothetical protein
MCVGCEPSNKGRKVEMKAPLRHRRNILRTAPSGAVDAGGGGSLGEDGGVVAELIADGDVQAGDEFAGKKRESRLTAFRSAGGNTRLRWILFALRSAHGFSLGIPRRRIARRLRGKGRGRNGTPSLSSRLPASREGS